MIFIIKTNAILIFSSLWICCISTIDFDDSSSQISAQIQKVKENLKNCMRSEEHTYLAQFIAVCRSGCSPGSTLKKKKGQTSDQCGSHNHTMGGLAYAKTPGLGPTVPQPGLFRLSTDEPRQY